MLPKQLPLMYCFLASASFGLAQHHRVTAEKSSPVTTINGEDIRWLPFSRGINEFAIQQNFDYLHLKPENTDLHSNNVNADIDYNRMVADHFGLGLEAQESFSQTKNTTIDSKDNNWMVYANLIYGTTLGSNFNLYGKFSVGVGQNKSVYNSSTTKENEFGYKFEAGAPIHLFNSGGNYLTPFVSYQFLEDKNSGVKNTDNTFSIGLKLQNYSSCSAYSCDCHHDRLFSRDMHDQGRSFIGYTTMGNLGFGKSNYDYNTSSNETNITTDLFQAQYGYYALPNLAIGAGLSWNSQSQKSNGSKYTSSDFLFTPMITANVPAKSCLNNLFLQGGYGFGFEKTSATASQKNNMSVINAGLGFDDFFSSHLAVTPVVLWEKETMKNTSTDTKEEWSGIRLGLGCKLIF